MLRTGRLLIVVILKIKKRISNVRANLRMPQPLTHKLQSFLPPHRNDLDRYRGRTSPNYIRHSLPKIQLNLRNDEPLCQITPMAELGALPKT